MARRQRLSSLEWWGGVCGCLLGESVSVRLRGRLVVRARAVVSVYVGAEQDVGAKDSVHACCGHDVCV